MIYTYDDRPDSEQLHARQVGESLQGRPQQPYVFEEAAPAGAEIDQQIAHVRWLMQREPMFERRELRIEN
jgi:hypothetical protein